MAIGVGSTLVGIADLLLQVGTEIEHWGMQRLIDAGHSIYQSNEEINGETGTNGGDYRITFLR